MRKEKAYTQRTYLLTWNDDYLSESIVGQDVQIICEDCEHYPALAFSAYVNGSFIGLIPRDSFDEVDQLLKETAYHECVVRKIYKNDYFGRDDATVTFKFYKEKPAQKAPLQVKKQEQPKQELPKQAQPKQKAGLCYQLGKMVGRLFS